QSFMNVNVGANAQSDVTANGLETSWAWRPTDAFELVGSVAYTKSELDDDDPGIGGVAGEQLPGIPELDWSLNGRYDFVLGGLDAFIGAGVSYQDERKTGFAGGGAIVPATPSYTMEDYTLVDLRAGVQFDRYAVSVYA